MKSRIEGDKYYRIWDDILGYHPIIGINEYTKPSIFDVKFDNVEKFIIDESIGIYDDNENLVYVNDILVPPNFNKDKWLYDEVEVALIQYSPIDFKYYPTFYSKYGCEGHSHTLSTNPILELIENGFVVYDNVHNMPELFGVKL